MAVNFSALVYLPNFDFFARPITITPRASQPSGSAYTSRGIYSTQPIDQPGMDGSIISEQQTICDILDAEHTVIPQQGDLVYIGPVDDIPGEGDFEIMDTERNGGGETTLVIRKFGTPKP